MERSKKDELVDGIRHFMIEAFDGQHQVEINPFDTTNVNEAEDVTGEVCLVCQINDHEQIAIVISFQPDQPDLPSDQEAEGLKKSEADEWLGGQGNDKPEDEPCPVCHGTGYSYGEKGDPEEACPNCEGTGLRYDRPE